MIADAPPANTPEWVEWRKGGLGASDLACILGLDPYRTEHELWEVKTGRVPASPGNPKTRWGHRMERLGWEFWGEQHPDWPYRVANDLAYRNPAYPHLWATPDALATKENPGKSAVGIEVKVTAAWQTPPERVRVQCLAQAGIADLERVDVVRLNFESDPAIFRIERDEAAIADILAAGEAWYVRHVIEGVEPPRRPDEAEADESQAQLAEDLRSVRKAMALLERRESAIRDDLIASVAGQGVITGHGFRIEVSRARAAIRTDWKALAEELLADMDEETLGETLQRYQHTGKPSTRLTARYEEEES